MQIKLFSIPSCGSAQDEEEVNRFLRSHRVLQVERHFCPEQGGSWALLVEYVDGDPAAEAPPTGKQRDRKDPGADLKPDERQRYDAMRNVRKEVARQLNLPAYLILTNEELAVLARLPEVTPETVKGLKGIAPQRLKDHISHFYGNWGAIDGEQETAVESVETIEGGQEMETITMDNGEESGQPDAENSQQGQPA